MGEIIIAGGGMCGLAAATGLADDGHRVTVFERDPAPPPPDPASAWDWDRRSVSQFDLGHWLHARGTSILRDQVPRAYQLLDDNGALHFNIVKFLLSLQPDAVVEPADDRFDVLTGRRSTLEWAVATAADEHPGVTVRRGAVAAGLVADSPSPGGVPLVRGLRLQSGEEIAADLVVDATGRRSRTPEWLAQIGAVAPVEHAEDVGFAYYSRYLRSADGSVPAVMAPFLSPLGSFSILTLPADNGTWSLILYGLADDKPLRRLREPAVFERVIRACPLHEHWLDGEPLSDIQTMAGAVDRHREFVVDGVPCATGILTVGDANSCTNPSLGRGITIGLMHVEVLRQCIADHLDDPAALALAYNKRTEAEIQPYHDATTAIDRRRVDEIRAYRNGDTPQPRPEDQITDLLAAAATSDPVAARAFGDLMSCNALPAEVMARPGVLTHIRSLADQTVVAPLPGPDRAQLIELVS